MVADGDDNGRHVSIQHTMVECFIIRLPEVFPESFRNIILHLATHEVCKDILHVFEDFDVVLLAFVEFDDRLATFNFSHAAVVVNLTLDIWLEMKYVR